MNVLVLSPYPGAVGQAIHDCGDSYTATSDSIDLEFCVGNRIEFLVSYGYRHLVRSEVLRGFPLKAINLHISLWPYARGAHPNFWSIAENAPTGVTIHLMDDGLDTGNILFQKEVYIDHNKHSFATSHKLLRLEIERLFKLNWRYIRRSECSGWRQQGNASYHRSTDIERWNDCLPSGWDTSISIFKQLAKRKPNGTQHFVA